DLSVAVSQAHQATDSAASARAAAREASVVEGYTRIVSPANGVVTERPVAPGTLVQPGTTILRIAEIDTVRGQAHVAVGDLGGIHAGSAVSISVGDAPPITSAVTSVFPAANDTTHTAVVEAILPNPGHRLLPGAFATMRIATDNSSTGLVVPST